MHKNQYSPPTLSETLPQTGTYETLSTLSHSHPSAPRSSHLIQHLCKHITKLQQLNTKLHEKIEKYEQQKSLICIGLGIQWEQILREFQVKYYQELHRNLQPTLLSKTHQNITNQNQNVKEIRQLLDTNVSQYGVENLRTPNRNVQSKSSLFQSPIQSQSRLINRSIHGNTNRQPQPYLPAPLNPTMLPTPLGTPSCQPLPFSIPPPTLFTLRDPLNSLPSQLNSLPYHPAVGLENHALQTHSFYNSTSNSIRMYIEGKENARGGKGQGQGQGQGHGERQAERDREGHGVDVQGVEEDNMILSIENTRLRQKITKLELIIAKNNYQ